MGATGVGEKLVLSIFLLLLLLFGKCCEKSTEENKPKVTEKTFLAHVRSAQTGLVQRRLELDLW